MKKQFASLLLTVAAASSLVACNNAPASTAVSSAASSAASSVASSAASSIASSAAGTQTEITFWSTIGQNNRPVFEKIVSDFEAAYPQYKINNVYQSGNYNQLKDMVTSGFAANNYPDLVQCYPDHVAEYINYGKAVDLTSYMNDPQIGFTAEDKADYIEEFMREGQEYAVTGTYSVPFSKSTELMFYNPVLLGLNLSSVDPTINEGNPLNRTYLENLTWEELFEKLCPAIVKYNNSLEASKKILKEDQAYHAVFAYDSDDNLFITLAEQYGYPYTSVNTTTGKGSADFNNDQMKALTKVFNEAAKKGYIISKGSAGNNYTNEYFTKSNTLFSVGSTGGVKYQFDAKNPFATQVARIPHARGKDPKVISQGPGLVVLSHNSTEREKASWLFYKFLTNKKNSLAWALDTGYMPVRKSGYTDNEYKEKYYVDDTVMAEASQDALMSRAGAYTEKIINETYTSPAFIGSSACRNAAGAIMIKAMTPTSTAADIDKSFTDNYTAAVKEIK